MTIHGLANFYDQTREARNLVVVDLGFLGDTVHLVPALWELKTNYPRAELHVVTSPVGVEVLRLAPCVDRAWALEQDADKRTFREQWQIIRALRRERFDAAFNFSGSDRTILLTGLISAQRRVGCPGGRWHFWNRWLIPDWVARPDPEMIVFEQRRQVLAACGLRLSPPRFDLRVDPESSEWAARIVPPMAIHLSVSSSKATREWPLEHHAVFLRTAWAEWPGLQILVSAGAREREQQRLQALAVRVNDPRLKSLPAGLTIPQLAAVLRRCRLHLGPDSGVLHLAVALDVPTISFFRQQGAYQSFMPVGARHRVISMPCHCVDHRDAPCERLGEAECFRRIEPGRVAALVRERLSLGSA